MFNGGIVMSITASTVAPAASLPGSIAPASLPESWSTGQQLAALGWEINANQYRVVGLAARFDDERDWFRLGHRSASAWIASQLQVQTSTAAEWVRVGRALRYLPVIDAAFAAQEISSAKARILTRWADTDNEPMLLELARNRSAGRLMVAIAKALADEGETDAERDARLHDERSFTTWTDGDGMTVIRIALAPSVAEPVVAAVDEMMRRIAQTPLDETDIDELSVADPSPTVTSRPQSAADALPATLRDLRRRWQPVDGDEWVFPSVAQQRADAFVALFLGCNVDLTSEVVIHVRGDGVTFDDGTPTTDHAVLRQLDHCFVRLLIHDAERRPINASSRRRHPTTRQQRVVMEAHGHECVDCQSTDLLELDHNPAFEHTLRTVTHELEPRCAPCHRARHRRDRKVARDQAAA